MNYTVDFTLNSGGSSANPQVKYVKVTDGVIHKIQIVFPAGCSGLVHVAIYDGGHPIAPSTAGQYYRGDDEVVDFPEFYEIKGGTRYLQIIGWNEDDTYDHTIMVRIFILPRWAIMPAGAAEGLIHALRSLFKAKEED